MAIKDFSKVDPVDRIPDIEIDETALINYLSTEKSQIDTKRTEWLYRKLEYMEYWDNFTQPKQTPIIEGQEFLHIPMIFEKIQNWHARMYKAIFSVDPFFHIEPIEKSSQSEVDAVKKVMSWYLKDKINRGDGLKPVFDELIWDIGTDGWACLTKRWETIERKMIDIEKVDQLALFGEAQEINADVKKRGRPRQEIKEYKEVAKVVKIYDGIILETVPQENAYFPEYIPTSGDMNYPKLVMLEIRQSEQELMALKNRNYYNADATDAVLKAGNSYQDETIKQQIHERRRELAGVNSEIYTENPDFPIYICYCRDDFDNDGYPEEYVFMVSFHARRILRKTYLDRICRDGNRPIYKFDLIKRPRSSYSRGFCELLYAYSREIDDFHNIRRANALIANVPWGWYRAGSGMEKEAIRVKAGVFNPIDDPQSDVREAQFKNSTTAWVQEEGLTQSYADRLTSQSPIQQGQVPQTVGPLRSTSGVQAILNETNTPLDVYLDRFRIPFGKMLNGVHSDLKIRLPKIIPIKVAGEDSNFLYGSDGQVKFDEFEKDLIMGTYKWHLSATNAQYNPEKDKQDAMARTQLLMSQSLIQIGIVRPENLYNTLKDLLRKSGEIDPDKYLTAPPDILKPMSLYDEYVAITNGRMPLIMMHDDHEAKIAGLVGLLQSPEFEEGLQKQVVSPLAPNIFNQVIQTHQAYLQIISQLQAAPNQSGMQIPATPGAAATGKAPQQQQEEQPSQQQAPQAGQQQPQAEAGAQ